MDNLTVTLNVEGGSYVVEEVLEKRINEGKVCEAYMQIQSDCWSFFILQVEYYLKWLGYDSKDNTWEPEELLDCDKLIQDYEDSQAKNIKGVSVSNYYQNQIFSTPQFLEGAAKDRAAEQKIKSEPSLARPAMIQTFAARKSANSRHQQGAASTTFPSVSSQPTRTPKGSSSSQGFVRGLQAERIIGITEINNQLQFLIKWAGTDQADFVPTEEANIKYPSLVIQFYEEHLTFVKIESEYSLDD